MFNCWGLLENYKQCERGTKAALAIKIYPEFLKDYVAMPDILDANTMEYAARQGSLE